jgi:hypothetical protein
MQLLQSQWLSDYACEDYLGRALKRKENELV